MSDFTVALGKLAGLGPDSPEVAALDEGKRKVQAQKEQATALAEQATQRYDASVENASIQQAGAVNAARENIRTKSGEEFNSLLTDILRQGVGQDRASGILGQTGAGKRGALTANNRLSGIFDRLSAGAQTLIGQQGASASTSLGQQRLKNAQGLTNLSFGGKTSADKASADAAFQFARSPLDQFAGAYGSARSLFQNDKQK